MECNKLIFLVFFACSINTLTGQLLDINEDNILRWCTISTNEQYKCQNFSLAVKQDSQAGSFGRYRALQVECKQGFNKDECMNWLDEGVVHVTNLDAGEVFIGGRYHSLIPIMQEVSEGAQRAYYAVAVVKKNSLPDVHSLRDLRGKRACFAGVGTQAGWVIPIQTMMRDGGLEVLDCNNHVKSAINFFGPSCAVDSLADKYNPIGDNSDKLCSICTGAIPGGRCTSSDPYAGFEGAFRCLVEAGDIAFLKHTTVQEMTGPASPLVSVRKENFELLCRDGTRRSVEEYRTCNWGSVPTHAIVTSSAQTVERRRAFQDFLKKVVQLYGGAPPLVTYNRTSTDQSSDFNRDRDSGLRNPNLFDRQDNRQGDIFGRQDQFGRPDQSGRQDQFGRQDQSGRQDPFGRQDQFGRPDQSGRQDQFGRPEQGRQDQFGRPEQSGRQDQFGRPEQSGRQDQFGRPDQAGRQDQFGRQDQSGRQDQFGRSDQSGRQDQFGRPINNQDSFDQFGRSDQSSNRERVGRQVNRLGQDLFGRNTQDRQDIGANQFDRSEGRNSAQNSEQNLFVENFKIFESAPRYGIHHNLLIQDTARDLIALDENRQTYSGYLGAALEPILQVRECPVRRMTLCVTSDAEMEKCVKMRTALKAQLLKPEMSCYKGHSHIHCMQAIRNGDADVSVLDASDVYTGGLRYDLIPFIAEVYNLGQPEYYVVAVTREDDPATELTYLKGKYTCHTGINTAAGWVLPLAYLISNGWVRSYGCDSVRAAAEYFGKSCVPGALSTEYNTGVPYDNLCHLCHGSSFRYCRRDASEDYYGHTGAFRCLVEGGGDVAFVKHTTVMENTDGKRREWWARNTLTDDFELLCPDGTRSPLQDYTRCNLGKVKANAVVTRGGAGYNETELHAFTNLFVYAQQFYGRKDPDEYSFSMFYSPPPYFDLIFQDAAQQLLVLPPKDRHFRTFLGRDFMRARALVDCHAGASQIVLHGFLLVVLGIVIHLTY